MMQPSSTRRLLLVGMLMVGSGVARADEREDFFEAKIRPVLAETCFRCHGDAKTSGALRVDSREALLAGGDSGPALVPGNSQESLLVRAIQRQDDVSAMPPEQDKTLRPDQVADFITWIQAGAVWPAKSARFAATKHWAFEPVQDPPLPEVHDRSWGQTSIDAFIRARQEAAGAKPAPPADRRTLIRRATFDLTGLPPTPQEVEAFLDDTSPAALATVVERLLASPAYGERWGRHWLDVVRYADTAGETADYPVPLAWRYRNYVIDAFNADKPYDEFLREQIAGDVLAMQGPVERYAERVTATGYLAISRRFGFDSENYHHLTIQDTIDTLGQSVLGLSLGCARCHDHKFDAVTMHDYYGLYGIFDSSRYAFPGSEQKQKTRSMSALEPPSLAHAKWQQFETKVAALAGRLDAKARSGAGAVLRSLSDIDGDFELQAAASGGSNGVLVPPWVYEGKIAVTGGAQSPLTNLHPAGKVGVSVPAGPQPYRIRQSLHPERTAAGCGRLFVNLDFRVTADEKHKGRHRFALGKSGSAPAIEVFLAADAVSLRSGDAVETLGPVKPGAWHNLQLALDLKARTVSGTVGVPGAMVAFSNKPLVASWSGVIDSVEFDSPGPVDGVALELPALEFDNLAVQELPIAPVATTPTPSENNTDAERAALNQQLQSLGRLDYDFELQTPDAPPVGPWSAGPNSVVKLSAQSQSPFSNLYPPGELGTHMPNRAAYDGFGLSLEGAKPDAEGRLFVGFDFRCASRDAGGDGSWRFYVGHGPGNSAAVELFFNGSEFFRRSGDAREAVGPLVVGQWYQVQLTLDLRARTYSGSLASPSARTEFQGELASGWDGTIDYSFIDSYGHLGGVRPALDVDNFVVSDKGLPPLDAPSAHTAGESREARRAQLDAVRRKLAALEVDEKRARKEFTALLSEGPLALTYGVAEGTPHDVRMQLRGEPSQPGPVVPRGFVKVLGGGTLPADAQGSGRLELAQWLTGPDNPLTARVMVNRIWQYHFGRGLVNTPNDFGVRGLPPTHPELLDHLATQFVRSGWSVKAMHREILLSATYQQAPSLVAAEGAGNPPADAAIYASFPRRRLSAEEIRDAILMVSGEMDPTPAQEHPFPAPTRWSYTQHSPFSAVYDHDQRSVYLMTQRLKRHPFLALFDGADPNTTTAQRLTTTVPTQALFFLNDPFVHAKAQKWAARLLAASSQEGERIELAWQRALGRSATASEQAEAVEFLAAYRAELVASGAENVELSALAAYLRSLIGSNEFLHVE